jgi:hypothetical protein
MTAAVWRNSPCSGTAKSIVLTAVLVTFANSAALSGEYVISGSKIYYEEVSPYKITTNGELESDVGKWMLENNPMEYYSEPMTKDLRQALPLGSSDDSPVTDHHSLLPRTYRKRKIARTCAERIRRTIVSG